MLGENSCNYTMRLLNSNNIMSCSNEYDAFCIRFHHNRALRHVYMYMYLSTERTELNAHKNEHDPCCHKIRNIFKCIMFSDTKKIDRL